MNKSKRKIAFSIVTPIAICGVLSTTPLKVDSMEIMNRNHCHGFRQSLLQESVNKLKANGSLTEEDVKNIECYMNKEREVKEKEIKEKIYNSECEKIDNMVSGKVITKEKGDKIKDAMKENLQQ